jgi:hypothetical protein
MAFGLSRDRFLQFLLHAASDDASHETNIRLCRMGRQPRPAKTWIGKRNYALLLTLYNLNYARIWPQMQILRSYLEVES